MTITNQPSGKPRKSATPPPPNRLPMVRERRPALAALAVLLIVGGAVLAGWLALREGHTSAYLVVDHEIPLGAQISSDDLSTVELPDTGLDLIPSSERNVIVGKFAMTTLEPGTILVQSVLGTAPKDPKGLRTVGYSLSAGQFPNTMLVGDSVALSVSTSSGGPSKTTTGLVRYLQKSDSGGGASVDIVISETCANPFAYDEASGNIVLSTIQATDSVQTCDGTGAVPVHLMQEN